MIMKLIDKSALVAEIEKFIERAKAERVLLPKTILAAKNYLLIEDYNKLLSFIDTLEVKEVDLENFIKEEFNKYACVDGYGQLSVSYNMAEFYGMIKRLTKAQKGE